jgi:hypothetical protein
MLFDIGYGAGTTLKLRFSLRKQSIMRPTTASTTTSIPLYTSCEQWQHLDTSYIPTQSSIANLVRCRSHFSFSTMSGYLQYLRVPVLTSTIVAGVASSILYFKQNELIYPRALPPDARTNVPKPSQFGLTNFEDLLIPTPDGESLSCFLIKPSNRNFARNVTILMFHGNAGNIGHRVPIAKILTEELGCNVLMLQYRGYGLSTGSPNENGITIDAQTGLDYIRQRADLRDSKIVIYGQSLGGAVGIGLAANNHQSEDIAGIILENTFTSIRKMIPR